MSNLTEATVDLLRADPLTQGLDEQDLQALVAFVAEHSIEYTLDSDALNSRHLQRSVTLDVETMSASSHKIKNLVVNQEKLLTALSTGAASLISSAFALGQWLPISLCLLSLLGMLAQLKDLHEIKLSAQDALALWSLYLAMLKLPAGASGCDTKQVHTRYRELASQYGYTAVSIGEFEGVLHRLVSIQAVTRPEQSTWRLLEQIFIVE